MEARNLMNYDWTQVTLELGSDPALLDLWYTLQTAALKDCCLDHERFDNAFTYIGAGSFKEAWAYTSPVDHQKYVVKLCSEENDTFEEAGIQDKVIDAEVMGFLPTVYLPISIPAQYLPDVEIYNDEYDEDSDEYQEEYYYERPVIQYVAVQPMIDALLCDVKDKVRRVLYKNWQICSRIPALYGRKCWIMPYIQWLRDYNEAFGDEMMQKFADFVENEGIHDLHSSNIGYFCGKPVIFDWLS